MHAGGDVDDLGLDRCSEVNALRKSFGLNLAPLGYHAQVSGIDLGASREAHHEESGEESSRPGWLEFLHCALVIDRGSSERFEKNGIAPFARIKSPTEDRYRHPSGNDEAACGAIAIAFEPFAFEETCA